MTGLPRRLAFCITELDPGGAERALVQIVARLDRSRWEPRVYSLAGRGEMAGPLESAGVAVHCLQARNRFDLRVIGRLRRELRTFRPEVLQTFLFHANLVGRMAAWRGGTPVVVSGVRVMERDARRRIWLDRWTNGLVTHNVCVSQSIASQYRSLGIPAEKLSVIANGVDVDAFQTAEPADLTQLGIPAGARVLLAVGRLHRQKGFDLLLEAAAPLLAVHRDLHVLIVGEGPERKPIEQWVAQCPHGSRVRLAGRRGDVSSLMRACDLFVLSSRWEGMPNVVLEAMAAGLPIVATDVEGVRDVVLPQETGLIVEPESPAALRVAIEHCLASSDRERLGRNGQQRVQSEFTWQRAADRYAELYERLLA